MATSASSAKESRQYQFMTSLLTFYLKGVITVSDRGVRFDVPNTILKFIPLGKKSRTIPIEQISTVDSSFKVEFSTLLIGIVAIILGFFCFGGGSSDAVIAGILILLFGANEIIAALQTELVVNSTGGESLQIAALIFDKNTIEAAGQDIESARLNRTSDTNTRAHVEASTDRIVDALSSR